MAPRHSAPITNFANIPKGTCAIRSTQHFLAVRVNVTIVSQFHRVAKAHELASAVLEGMQGLSTGSLKSRWVSQCQVMACNAQGGSLEFTDLVSGTFSAADSTEACCH